MFKKAGVIIDSNTWIEQLEYLMNKANERIHNLGNEIENQQFINIETITQPKM